MTDQNNIDPVTGEDKTGAQASVSSYYKDNVERASVTLQDDNLVTIDGVTLERSLAEQMGLMSYESDTGTVDSPVQETVEQADPSDQIPEDILHTEEAVFAYENAMLVGGEEKAQGVAAVIGDAIASEGAVSDDMVESMAKDLNMTFEQFDDVYGKAVKSQYDSVMQTLGQDGYSFLQSVAVTDDQCTKDIQNLVRRTAVGDASKSDWSKLVTKYRNKHNA